MAILSAESMLKGRDMLKDTLKAQHTIISMYVVYKIKVNIKVNLIPALV